MQYIILILLFLPFSYFNYKIILSDIKEKIIPNKYLIYLLYLAPFIGIYNYYYHDSDFFFLLLQTIIGTIISFVLYYKGIWSAGDAKYLLILSLFISSIGIIPFLGNIAILVMCYLLLYYFYFYIGKCLLQTGYANTLYQSIYTDLKEKLSIFLKHSDGNLYTGHSLKILLNWFLIFLFFFVGFRLARLLIVSNFIVSKGGMLSSEGLFQKYHIYISIFLYFLYIAGRYLFVRIFQIFKRYLGEKLNIRYDKTGILLPIILILFLTGIIIIEYFRNPYEVMNFMYKIFTFYIALFIIVRILLYSYKITFQIAETYFIRIDELKEGEIVDKQYLSKMFGEQVCLGYGEESGLLHPDPREYFLHIENPIDAETCHKLQEIFSTTNAYQIENSGSDGGSIKDIKILKTFPFAPYILIGFFITFIFQDSIFSFLSNTIISFIKNFHS